MALSTIRATFTCDGCGQQFRVDVDPATRAWERRQDLMSFAENALAGGSASDGGFCSMQHDLHLCGECTRVSDSINPDQDDYQPSRDEILEALGAS